MFKVVGNTTFVVGFALSGKESWKSASVVRTFALVHHAFCQRPVDAEYQVCSWSMAAVA